MGELNLDILSFDKCQRQAVITVESFIVLVLCHYLKKLSNIRINLIKTKSKEDRNEVRINLSGFPISKILNVDTCSPIMTSCELPTFITDGKRVISGLCGVCRIIIKECLADNTDAEALLGFKMGCLLAPSEISVWTKFCEIDITNCVKKLLSQKKDANCNNSIFEIPEEFSKYEDHLGQPIKMHNIYKLARELSTTKEEIPCSIPRSELSLEHTYAQGFEMTLTDVILFSCYYIILMEHHELELLEEFIPLTMKWYKMMRNNFISIDFLMNEHKVYFEKNTTLTKFKTNNHSFYKTIKNKTKYNHRYTKQDNIDHTLRKLNDFNIKSEAIVFNETDHLCKWESLPYEVQPEGGNLPMKRLVRKKQQLENLVYEVLLMAEPDDVIVDFCSGTGHLGIVLAYLLPQCQVILLENKEESLNRAEERVRKLNLENVMLYQCNLDYFHARFDIGVSLHACGVATDIVMDKCYTQEAKFVCCPCCYGKIQQTHHITYPRSQLFRDADIQSNDYTYLSHCADQTHSVELENCNIEKSLQGEFCMDVIDSDRKYKAEELDYIVKLKKLTPENCTPKNRLLVGYKR